MATQVLTSCHAQRTATKVYAQSKSGVSCDACGNGVEEPSTETMAYCPQCCVNLEFCNACRASNPNKHAHPLITLRTIMSKAPTDFWRDIVSETDGDRCCDACNDTIASRIDQHIRCASCDDCDFCINCVADRKADFRAHRCRGSAQREWDFYGVEGVDERYLQKQMVLADAERRRLRCAGKQKLQKIDTSRDAVESSSSSSPTQRSPSSSISYPVSHSSQVRQRRPSPG